VARVDIQATAQTWPMIEIPRRTYLGRCAPRLAYDRGRGRRRIATSHSKTASVPVALQAVQRD
jgi:hypothetical protein